MEKGIFLNIPKKALISYIKAIFYNKYYNFIVSLGATNDEKVASAAFISNIVILPYIALKEGIFSSILTLIFLSSFSISLQVILNHSIPLQDTISVLGLAYSCLATSFFTSLNI